MDDDARRYVRNTTREADEIKLLYFPEGSQWRAWRAHTIHSIVSAAGRQDDLGQEWVMKVETEEPEALEDPGEGWISLDRKLAAALTKIAKGDIGRQQHHRVEQQPCCPRACDVGTCFSVLLVRNKWPGVV